jgi:hypothetical protein
MKNSVYVHLDALMDSLGRPNEALVMILRHFHYNGYYVYIYTERYTNTIKRMDGEPIVKWLDQHKLRYENVVNLASSFGYEPRVFAVFGTSGLDQVMWHSKGIETFIYK